MPHETTLIATIVMGLVLAFAGGFVASKLRLPPLVGYLLAGVAIGPFTPGFVGDEAVASQLAEIGVILLMFGVGLHFSIKDLMAVRRIAIPGAVGQIVVAPAPRARCRAGWLRRTRDRSAVGQLVATPSAVGKDVIPTLHRHPGESRGPCQYQRGG